jgi:Uma2 family endonuclease
MALLSKSEKRRVTGEELFRRPDLEPCELVEGKIVPMSPTGFLHGDVELELGGALRTWARETGRGRAVGGEVGIYVRRSPDTVRAADLLYISRERLAGRTPVGYLDVAPELVVEILSPDDRWDDVMEKLAEYFVAGVDRVWVVAPKLRSVFAYRSLTESRQLGEGDLLSDEEILPGFALPVARLFQVG